MYSVEWNKDFENIDLYADISQVTAQDILEKFGHPDVIWASPDCTTFSIAAISHHRRKNPETGNLDPISDYAKFCDATDQHVVSLIKELTPTYYFIENPRGGMRKMTWMQDLPRYTVTYCKYGDTRMKPTDIWTNHPKPKFLPIRKVSYIYDRWDLIKKGSKDSPADMPNKVYNFLLKHRVLYDESERRKLRDWQERQTRN